MKFIPKLIVRYYAAMSAQSGLSFIKIRNSSDPGILCKEWIEDAAQYGATSSVMNLATSTRSGEVSNRTVVIREFLPDGSPTFIAHKDSKKIKNIKENSQVSATVLLTYNKDSKHFTKQIRISGIAEKLSFQQCESYYNRDSISAKIRAYICTELGPTDWQELKKQHDALLAEVNNGKVLQMPDTQVAYKIVPKEIELYFSQDHEIADRLLFKNVDGTWIYEHLKP